MQGAEPTMCHLDFSWRKPAFVPEVRGWGQAGAREGQGGAAAREGTCLHPRPHASRNPGRGTSDFSGRQGRTALSRAATTAKLWQPRDLPRRPRPGLTYRSPPPPSAAAPWPDTLTGTAAAETGADTDREPRPAARPRPRTLGLRGHAPEQMRGPAGPAEPQARLYTPPSARATPFPWPRPSGAAPLPNLAPESSKAPPPSPAWDRARSWPRPRAPPRRAPAPQTPRPRRGYLVPIWPRPGHCLALPSPVLPSTPCLNPPISFSTLPSTCS